MACLSAALPSIAQDAASPSVAPAPQKLVITALGGSTATPPDGITAEIVRFTSLEGLDAAPASAVAGRIVFLDEYTTRTQDRSRYGTGPGAALSPPDADQLARLLERGPVRLKLTIRVEMSPSVPPGNAIAEIRGRGKPDEIVLIGCLLDSWDAGTGALEDAAGCGIVVGAAKLILARGERPLRTIRVMLYGAEEVGRFGAEAHAREHAADLANHVIAAESDFGVGAGHNDSSGSPDFGPLVRAGVPIAGPQQDGTDYFDYHHTPDDTFDKIVPAQFRHNVAVYAAFAWLAAEAGWDFRN
jgi:hypothetical protein